MTKFDPNLICPLCGLRKAENNGKYYNHKEHIPPKSIFTDNKSQRITVPSCKLCNAGTSALDEEFKYSMGVYLGYKSPELWASTIRTLHKNKRLKKETFNNISSVPVLRNGELSYVVKMPRESILAVVKKICRGLHWHITNEIVPHDLNPEIFLIKQDANVDPDVAELLGKFGKILSTGGGNFSAQYAIVENVKYASIWNLRFYGEDCFFAAFRPNKTVK